MTEINAWIAKNDPNAPLYLGGETLKGLPAIISYFSTHALPKESKVPFCLLLSRQISTNPALANPVRLLMDQLFANQVEAMEAFKAALSQNDVEGAKVFYRRLNSSSRSEFIKSINLDNTIVIFLFANEVLEGDEKEAFYNILENRWVQDNPPYGQDALERIKTSRAEKDRLLSLDVFQLRTLPPFLLRDLAHVTTLQLRKNQLTTFTVQPLVFPLLRDLRLSWNQLSSFVVQPGAFPRLDRLILNSNQLTSFSAHLGTFPALRMLNLIRNQLTTFAVHPEAVPELSELHLIGNPQLRELPLALLRCTNLSHIDIDPSLAEQAYLILANAQRIRETHATATLPEKINLWSAYSGKRGDFSFVSSLDDPKKRLLNEWLHRLVAAAEFRNNQQGLASIVCDILASLNPQAPNYNAPFAESFYVQLLPNLERCGDRAGETLNIAYAAWVMHHLPPKATDKEKLELLVKAAKAFALNKAIAKKLAGRPHQEENVEVHLYYKTLFKDEIITAVQSYAYADRMGNIKLSVEELRETMNTNCWDELTDLDTFKNLLFKNEEFMEEYNNYLEALETAHPKKNLDLLQQLEGLSLEDKTLALQKQLMIQHAKRIL